LQFNIVNLFCGTLKKNSSRTEVWLFPLKLNLFAKKGMEEKDLLRVFDVQQNSSQLQFFQAD
jgi:hypothetical protein